MIDHRLEVPEAELLDLRDRLLRTRWPEAETVGDWSQGVPLAYLRELCDYWATGYDWRRVESRLNALPQFKTEIDGLGIHFLHVRSPHPGATPLVLTSGWPGSILEFLKVIEPLTDPPDPADAFHVVCPSIPGFGFSDKPAEPGWGIERIAGAWLRLMSELGYERFGAQGSDWGTSITTCMAVQAPERLIGIHLMPPLAAPDPDTFGDLTEAEQQSLDALRHASEWEDGYSAEQSTKPQTIGYSLVDSPVGLCAWIVEKLRSWTDCGGDVESVLTKDEILDSVMIYWLPGTGASSARLYWESIRQVQKWFTEATADLIEVPTGCTLFPRETPRPSRRWAANRYTNIVYWSEPERGGHFAALEQPESFVREVRAFFRVLLDN
ncbi:epoxide hydrolase family protein [Amycolatopsis magusensis]|uniref:epoxide hydrolase family protein n=1 Tax=Amycolatopsis magusensis TaxID=882444 RepID=UPI0037BB3A11